MSKYDDIDPMELDDFLRSNPRLGVDDYLREKRSQVRGRAIDRTPGSSRRRKVSRVRSRSVGTQPMQLSYPSMSKSRSPARPGQGRMDPVLSAMLSGNYKPYEDALKRIKANSRKVRHKNARKVLKKMPSGGRPYAKRRPKGKAGYRGVVTPKWMKGETKHILVTDNGHATAALGLTAAGATKTATEYRTLVSGYSDDHSTMNIGAIAAWSLNPVGQGLTREDRNGQSIDGTYCRVQGHIHNVSNNGTGSIQSAGQQRAYVRMLVLAVKGGRAVGVAGTAGRPIANFDKAQLFKKIDGSVVGFDDSVAGGKASARVRTLQLGVNKSYYTLLSDRKYELSGTSEGFGSSDRLFDIKIPLKQKSTYADEHVDAWEKNQIVLVCMTVDPNMNDTVIDASGDARKDAIQLEFESKYSYKDF